MKLPSSHQNKTHLALYGAALLFVGGGIGYAVDDFFTERAQLPDIFETSSDYKFINPLLSCSDIENYSDATTKRIRLDVEGYLAKETAKGNVDTASIYFRDLNNGPWFGINERLDFLPASLLKTPLLISVLNMAERDPSFLDQKILYEGSNIETYQSIKPEKQIISGNTYTIAELLHYLIVYSDNNAVYLLSDIVGDENVLRTYKHFGIDIPKSEKYAIRAKTIASFFRVLYNASYLSKDYSEIALSIFSQTKFREGLPAGVPPGITVAHKFGEFLEQGSMQFHDCGIVYYPRSPYILCVMTKGKSVEKLVPIVAEVSRIVYEGIRGGGVDSE